MTKPARRAPADGTATTAVPSGAVSPQIAARRTRVSRLAADDMSARAIGELLGVSKDTVLRDLAALAHTDAPPAHQTAPAASSGARRRAPRHHPARTTVRRRRTPSHANPTPSTPPGAPADAAAHATPPPGSDPAHWPAHLAVPYDHNLHYDLRWLGLAGLTDPAAAIRWAVERAATAISAEHSRTGRMPTITPGD